MIRQVMGLLAVLPLLVAAHAAVPQPAAGPITDLCGLDVACYCDMLGWRWCGTGREPEPPRPIEPDPDYPVCDVGDEPGECPYYYPIRGQ